MCKYEMDPMSIVEDRADTILSTDRQTDKVKPVYPPFNFVEAGVSGRVSYLFGSSSALEFTRFQQAAVAAVWPLELFTLVSIFSLSEKSKHRLWIPRNESKNLVNIRLGNGLLPDGSKPLRESMLTS